MLKNIFLKTVRDNLWSVLIWGGGLALLMLSTLQAYNGIFSGPNKAQMINNFKQATEAFSFLTGKAYDLDTFGGYLNYQFSRTGSLLLPIFALLMGSKLIRGEEEKGSLDLLLSTPHSRQSVLFQKWAGMVAAIAGIMVIVWLGIAAGVSSADEVFEAGPTMIMCLNTGLLVLVIGSLALIMGQVTSRKAAAGWAGGIFAGTFLVNNLSDNLDSLKWFQYFSPFYYHNLSKPLARSIGINWGGMAVLTGMAVGLTLVALAMYLRRDHNDVFHLFQSQKPGQSKSRVSLAEPKSFWLTNNFTFGLRAALPGTLIWAASMSAYIVLIMFVLNDLRATLIDLLKSDFYKNLGLKALAGNESLLSIALFVFAVALYAAYAVTQVAGWTSEENEGRLELVLSTPEPRWRLLLTRFLVTLVASAILVGLTGLAFGLSGWIANVTVDTERAIETFFGLWIICVAILAAGFLLAAFGPGRAVAIVGGLVIVSYLAQLLGNLLKLPEWIVNLSIFQQYGQPLLSGLNWPAQAIILGLSLAFVVVAALRFEQRDLVK